MMVAWSALFHNDDAYVFDVISSTKRKALSVAVHHVLKRHTSRRDPCGRGPQGKKRRDPAPFSWAEHVLRLNEKEFKQRYRLNHESFYKLCDILRPDLEVKDPKQAKKSRFGTVVPVEVKLAIALRFFAGGMVLDLRLIYHVSQNYVYQCVWNVVDAVNQNLHYDFPIDDVGELQKLEKKFRDASIGQIWAGQVGAIDGVHFAMRNPGNKQVKNAKRYHVKRKDGDSMPCR